MLKYVTKSLPSCGKKERISTMIDLHTHSTASDGSLSPSQLVALAAEQGLSAIALTDHDTADGISEALSAAAKCRIELIPGIEMSCVWRGTEIHLLGYFLDADHSAMRRDLSWFRKKREERNDTILDNLAEDGIVLSREELCFERPDTAVTRAHFARLLAEKGYVKTPKEAFSDYLVYGGRYVPTKDEITPELVMRFFQAHGIWPSLAHPVQYQLSEEALGALLSELCPLGLRGLEVWHSSQDSYQSARLLGIARLLKLLPTGGSDFHGDSKPDIMLGRGFGSLRIQEHVLENMKTDLAAMRQGM